MVRAHSAQNLSEDEDFDLSCPDMAERLDEDYWCLIIEIIIFKA